MAVLALPAPLKESSPTMRIPGDRKRPSCTLLLAIALACGQFVAGAGAALAQAGNARQAVEGTSGARDGAKAATKATAQARPKAKRGLDRSGRKQVGKASYYARKFAGRKMADGTPMKPHGNNAASKTLPLGTTARVTNLETGQSATVVVRDRGPYVPGRIIDLSPSTAQAIGITREQGVAQVEVDPIDVPPPKN
jgi:rare lipoprotein A